MVAAYLFLAPDLLGLLVFVVLPMCLAFGVALFEVDGFGNYTYVGFDNYALMADDDKLLQSLRVTGMYVVAFVPLAFVSSLGIALLVRRQFRGVGAVRAAFFLPNVISLVVAGLMWQFLLVDKRGIVGNVLGTVGLGDVSLLGEPSLALATFIAISVWFMMGYQMMVFLAGLKDIPADLEDAATVDGAGVWQRFRHVTWPLLRPTSFFVLVTSTVAAVTGVQAFDLVYVLTKGGPANSTSTIVYYIYEQAFTLNNIGYASAVTTLAVGILMVGTALMFALTRGGRFDED
ncbi:carbohydrate ABC transporter permease [Solicola gregarius]|uniref:Sugar ABC transporter permease n=1 Tax=Solicola gregarius TaxID=2908642 RepID=A0AA46YLM1_9ACTN|nr:sugar ABC transporter permease [Solicola gregarius]UYM05008.1 sugar ABC transporter permease [Solicola gregarius]